jgi:hypothetical protein
MVDLRTYRPGTVRTSTGLYLDPWDPDIEVLRIKDIAHALAQQARFNGHASRFYSVAEHSVLVSKLVSDEFAMWGLMHDAPEYILGDVVTPLKAKLPDFQKLENEWMHEIALRYIPDDRSWGHVPDEVRAMDKVALEYELALFLDHGVLPNGVDRKLLPIGLDWMDAERHFLNRFMDLI